MTQRDNILKELGELNSSLPPSAIENSYSVPAGYFEGLPATVLARIRALEANTASEETALLSPLLAQATRSNPFSLPAGYFEQLPAVLLLRIRATEAANAADELAALSPLLGGLKKETPYQVPPGYFELQPEIPAAHSTGRVISLTRRPWFRMAAAAVVTGIILMTGWLTLGGQHNNPEKAVAKFEKKLNKELDKMSDQELDDFIKYTDPDAGIQAEETAAIAPATEIKDLLNDISDTELKQFLEETSDAGTYSETVMMN